MSAILFATGYYEAGIVGALLFLFWTILDLSDGAIARANKNCTNNGLFLAMLSHYFSCYIIFVGIIIDVYNKTNEAKYLVLGLIIISFLASMNLIYFISKIVMAKFTRKLNTVSNKNISNKESINYYLIKVFRRIIHTLSDESGRVSLTIIFAFLGKMEYLIYIYILFTIISLPLLIVYYYFFKFKNLNT